MTTEAISPYFLPDEAPSEHPAPWRRANSPEEESDEVEVGHINVYDANGRLAAHVCTWLEPDYYLFEAKMAKINATAAEAHPQG